MADEAFTKCGSVIEVEPVGGSNCERRSPPSSMLHRSDVKTMCDGQIMNDYMIVCTLLYHVGTSLGGFACRRGATTPGREYSRRARWKTRTVLFVALLFFFVKRHVLESNTS